MYNKLFTKILDSSIWLAPDPHRLVWITILAVMDEDGMIHFACPANLAARARVSLQDAETAIAAFEAPDVNSGDPEFEGRRIERVPGGWIVLNAEKYRNLVTRQVAREGIRKRVAAFRDRQRLGLDLAMKAQNGNCGCCGQPFEEPYNLYVVQDHDHKTGKARDLVCQSCNKVIGLVENGKETRSEKRTMCVTYLKRHSNGQVTQSDSESDPYTKNQNLRGPAPVDNFAHSEFSDPLKGVSKTSEKAKDLKNRAAGILKRIQP